MLCVFLLASCLSLSTDTARVSLERAAVRSHPLPLLSSLCPPQKSGLPVTKAGIRQGRWEGTF